MADDHSASCVEKASLPTLLGGLIGTEKQFLSGKRDRGADLESAVKIFLEFLRGFEFFGDIDRPCVTVFGSARFAPGHRYYEMARELGFHLAKEGFAVAEEGPYVAALVTELTPELVQEGLAREFVRRVQDLRKSADLDVADRIELFVEASAGLRSALETHKEYITSETLTSNLVFASPPEGASIVEDGFEGEKVTVGLVKQ